MKLCQDSDLNIYQILFNIESYLRVYVRWNLRKQNPLDWKGTIGEAVVAESAKRRQQEIEIGYLDDRKSGCLSYLNLSELKDIILGPLWTAQGHDWPNREILSSEFKKLLGIRNKVAHFRPVTQRDTRVAFRFAEDLADWTRVYKTKRNYSKSTCDGEEGLEYIEKKLPGFLAYWSQRNNKENIYVSICDGHVCASVELVSGALDPDKLQLFITRHENVITFVRVDEVGGKFAPYFSIKSSANKILRAIKDMEEIESNTIEPLSSMDAKALYSLASHEGLLPWNVELPANFTVLS